MRSLLYSLYVLLGGVSYGLLAPFVKLAFEQGIPTGDSVRLQYFTGFLLLGLINLFFVRYRVGMKAFIFLFLSGIPMGLTTSFYYHSLEYLDTSISIVILFQYTWMGIVAELVIERVWPTREKVIAALLLFGGSLLAVNILGADLRSLPVVGVVLALLSAASFATFLYVSGKVAIQVPALRKSFVMSFGAAAIIAVVFPLGDFMAEGISFTYLGLGLMLGLFGVVLPPFLFSLGMPIVGSGLGTILSATELPTTMILSAIVVSERVTFAQWIGIVVIIVGIALANYPAVRRRRAGVP